MSDSSRDVNQAPTAATLTARVALVTAILSLATALLGFWQSLRNAGAIEALWDCGGQVSISVDTPLDNAQVGEVFDIHGSGTIHNDCRYVCVTVHDVSKPGGIWQVADLTQVKKNGQWTAKASLAGVTTVQGQVEIEARLKSRPTSCAVGQASSVPSAGGVPSNVVKVRRVQ